MNEEKDTKNPEEEIQDDDAIGEMKDEPPGDENLEDIGVDGPTGQQNAGGWTSITGGY